MALFAVVVVVVMVWLLCGLHVVTVLRTAAGCMCCCNVGQVAGAVLPPCQLCLLLLLLQFCTATGPIMALANELVYKGQLLAGSPQVEAAQLVLPQPDALQQVGRQGVDFVGGCCSIGSDPRAVHCAVCITQLANKKSGGSGHVFKTL